MPAPLLLADAPHLLYRAFYALPDTITDGDGRPVNALLGSVNQLMWCVDRYEPRAVVCCFGQEAASYRTEAYPPYHAHRPPVPDGLQDQWDRAAPFYEALGWHVMSHHDLEADDVLHALAAAEVAAGGRAMILTGDRDLFQCAGEHVTILLQRARQEGPDEMGPAEVEARYGVPPAAVPDFIALRGDPSDGLPGAKGIGEKTAAELLRRHGSLEAAIAGAVRERPAVRRALLEQADELRAFKDIATLRDADVERPPDRPTDRDAGAAAARALGMERLAKRLEEGTA
ncbi:MAG TPA: 5'-3' exonuclease [Solirubrobacteraceae bacterium]|nr:5'-3' exonuclease [Solirubrobacteraceae bacterium]